MALDIKFRPAARRQLRRVPEQVRSRIRTKLAAAALNPLLKGSLQLRDYPDVRRIRIGGWRVLYSWNEQRILVEAISSRGQIYKDM